MPPDLAESSAAAKTIEHQLRACIRDAANRSSRKPFNWGGLAGYRQLEAIAEALHELPITEPGMDYFQQLLRQVEQTLERNRALAEDLGGAQDQLIQIAQCLGYPTPHDRPIGTQVGKEHPHYTDAELSSAQIRQEMEGLLQKTLSISSQYPVQTALCISFQRRWQTYGSSLLHCYDIPGLPPDNLKLESVFGKLRNHARRITGRKSTRELRDFGQSQILFAAESLEDLLKQIQQVPLSTYKAQRESLENAEAPHRLSRQLHRNTIKTVRSLLSRYPNCGPTDNGSIPSSH